MKALVVVDMQVDFLPGGALGCAGADKLIPVINALIPKFPLVVGSKDWHPKNHCSFAATHPGKKVGDVVDVNGIPQILWPVHCVQNTPGAAFDPRVESDLFARVFFKGTDPNIDSYSAFYDNARKKSTGLSEYLKSLGMNEIFLAGLLTEYCVFYSTQDALKDGFQVTVIEDACKGIDLKPGDTARALEKIKELGGKVVKSKELLV
jgi:nicotinamidase/pyrazinamidase